MSSGIIALIVVASLFAMVALFVWSTYNSLVTLRQRVRESWSGIDVHLKRRASLIPNLVEAVKGYAAHERELLENVTKARAALMSATGPAEAAQADNVLTSTLRSLFAVSENYPQLKANQNFLELQRELADTESKIAYARQFYNTNVRDLNTRVETFPSVLIAQQFGFTPEVYFEAEETAREDVRVSFTI